MRKQIAAANWKMNLTIDQAALLFDEILFAQINVALINLQYLQCRRLIWKWHSKKLTVQQIFI